MKLLSRENTKLTVVAVFCVVVGSLTPTVAGAAQRAIAPNADKVDGKHAVGYGASVAARKGKLVATSGRTGRLPDNIIATAPNARKLGGSKLKHVTTHWLTVTADGSIDGSSPAASSLTVSHPAVGTYCVSRGELVSSSVAGNVQTQLNGFEDLTMIVSSTVNTSACPGEIRIYTARSGVLADSPFTLTFALAPPA